MASVISDPVSSWQHGQGVLSPNPCPNSFWSLPAAASPQRKNHLYPLPLAQGTICTILLTASPHTHCWFTLLSAQQCTEQVFFSWACEPLGSERRRGGARAADESQVGKTHVPRAPGQPLGFQGHRCRQMEGGKVEAVTGFIFLGSKITVDGDCSHEIRNRLLLGRKAMRKLDNVLKSTDITLLTKVCKVKSMVFPVVMYRCESCTIKKAEH